MKVISKYIPTDRQREAHECTERYVLYGGAMGGGKTVWLCQEAIEHCMRYPGNRVLMARFTLKDFKNTTLVTLLRDCPPEIIEFHNKSDAELKFKNGSLIKYTGLNDDDGVRVLKSFECGRFLFDEANEISYENFKLATTRLRWKLPSGKEPAYGGSLTSNPEDCWLKDIFVDGKGGSSFRFIQSLPTDNPHNPTDYVAQIRSAFNGDEVFIKRYLEGSWEDLTQGNFVIPKQYIEQAINKEVEIEGRVGLGIDVARFGEDETVMYVGDNGRVIESNFAFKRSTDQTSLFAQRLIKDFDVQITCIDDIGVGGGVTDFLGSYLAIPGITGVNVGKRADDERFFNMRAQLWWHARSMFEEGKVSIPNDPKLVRQLGAPLYRYRGSGKLIIEPKEDTKKRIGQSPDRADALILMLWATGLIGKSSHDYNRYYWEEMENEAVYSYGWDK